MHNDQVGKLGSEFDVGDLQRLFEYLSEYTLGSAADFYFLAATWNEPGALELTEFLQVLKPRQSESGALLAFSVRVFEIQPAVSCETDTDQRTGTEAVLGLDGKG